MIIIKKKFGFHHFAEHLQKALWCRSLRRAIGVDSESRLPKRVENASRNLVFG